jgi:hypothetical protein
MGTNVSKELDTSIFKVKKLNDAASFIVEELLLYRLRE